jgi:L-amino acid N-acyltransferase YncA
MVVIRIAQPADAKGILDIYGPYITNTSFTFETELPSLTELSERIGTYLVNWPWLVCEVDDKIAGYAYGARYRERVAYQWSVESSVYIHDDFMRSGIAKALYTALAALLKAQGFRNVYAVINLPNEKSVQFHENFGFEYFATYEQVGYKLGKWKNVGWWRLTINSFDMEPAAPIKFSELNPELVAPILENATKIVSV